MSDNAHLPVTPTSGLCVCLQSHGQIHMQTHITIIKNKTFLKEAICRWHLVCIAKVAPQEHQEGGWSRWDRFHKRQHPTGSKQDWSLQPCGGGEPSDTQECPAKASKLQILSENCCWTQFSWTIISRTLKFYIFNYFMIWKSSLLGNTYSWRYRLT